MSSGCRCGTAPVVVDGEVVGQRFGNTGGEAVLVRAALDAALGARTVVREEQHDGVVQMATLVERGEETPDLCIGVGEKAGEHLLLAAIIRRSSSDSASHALTHCGRSLSVVPGGTTPDSSWREKQRARQASQPSSNAPR